MAGVLASVGQGLLARPITFQPIHARTMSRFDRIKFWKKKEDSEVEGVEGATEEESEIEIHERQVTEMEREERANYIQSIRNKSKLSASHRQILHGEPPYEGNLFEYTSLHKSKEYKRSLLSKYGKRKTGVEPGLMWPTKEEVGLAREWEQLYQEIPLTQLIATARSAEGERKAAKLAREKKVTEALAAMDKQVSQWRDRVSARARLQGREKERRERVLEELKLEFGYAINPEDAYMKERIATREKVLMKEEREAKREKRKEKKMEN